MNLTTTARHFEADPDLLEHIEERLLRLKRYFDQILNVNVIMSVEKFRHIAEINVHVNGHDFNAKEESDDMFTSIDNSARSLERQIKRFKAKLKASHKKSKNHLKEYIPRERIVRSESIGTAGGIEMLDEHIDHEVAPLSVEEAVVSLNNGKRDFLLFNDTDSGRLNFVYRRSDGHYGVIDISE